MTSIVLELIKLATVGLIAGLFSSLLANRDHRQRKWWEMRVAAYQNAIEALSDLVYYYDRNFKALIESRELSPESQKGLDQFWDQAFPKIRKFADSGAFLFSDEANSALREFMEDERVESYFDHLDTKLDKAHKCLSRLVACSKVDLKLKPSLMDHLF